MMRTWGAGRASAAVLAGITVVATLTGCGSEGEDDAPAAVPAAVTATSPPATTAAAAMPAPGPASAAAVATAATTVPPTIGASGASTTDAADRPTKPEYVATVNAVCATWSDAIGAGLEQWKVDHGLDPAEMAPPELQTPMQQEVIVPMLIQRMEELRVLPRPPGDESEIQRWFDAFDAMLPAWSADPLNDEHWVEANAIATGYGLDARVC